MTIQQYIGAGMLAMVFVGIFVLIAWGTGSVRVALVILGFSVAGMAFISAAGYLLAGGH